VLQHQLQCSGGGDTTNSAETKIVPSQKIVPPAWESLDSGGCQYEKIVIIANFKKD